MAVAGAAAQTIDVSNPATGELVRTLAVDLAGRGRAMVDRARAAQPAWEALAFEGRGRVLRRTQKWLVDNADRVVRTIVDESGKTYEDAQLVELAYGAGALGFWAKRAQGYLADEKIRTSNPFVMGRRLVVRYRPLGVVGVIGPWNYPLTNNFGDASRRWPRATASILKPSQVTPLTSLLLAEGMRECGLPDGRPPGGDRRRRGGRGAHRRGRLRDVHRLDGDRPKVMARAARDAHAGRRSSSAARIR